MKTKIFLLALLLITITAVYAFDVYIRPPRMIARINLTETNTWNGFVEVKNTNNFTVNVTFTTTGNITDKINIINRVQLEPNQTEQVNFTLTAIKPGIYNGAVIAAYQAEGTVPIALQSEIIMMVSGTEKKQTNYIYAIPIVFALFALVALLIKRYRK